MKTKCLKKCPVALLITWLFCMLCAVSSVLVAGAVDTERSASLQVYFGHDGRGFAGVEFRLYRVADVSETGEFTLSGAFQEYPVELKNLDSSGWRTLAQTLDAYTSRDKISPQQTQKTAEDGRVSFSELPTGLYLVTGDAHTEGTAVYTPESMLVSLPGKGNDGTWVYDVEVFCKYETETQPAVVKRKVQKVWKDNGNTKARPKEITVRLLKNGETADTVVLNEANNWEYQWEDLDGRFKWQVTEEKVPTGYTVSVKQEGSIFVMTNTAATITPTKTPSSPSYKTPSSKLPQTGTLWWMVPILFCSGLLLIVLGLWAAGRRTGGTRCERRKRRE